MSKAQNALKNALKNKNEDQNVKYNIEDKPFCDECHKVFSNLGHLTRHKKTHIGKKEVPNMKVITEEKTFCDVCQKVFSSPEHLTSHKKTHIGEEYNSLICEDDKELISSRKNSISSKKERELKTSSIAQTQEKVFACDICDKSFPRFTRLAEHKQTHTVCEICNTVFSHYNSLTAHKRTICM